MDANLTCFWQQARTAVWRGTLAPELFEVGNCWFDLLGHEAVHVRAGRLLLPPGQYEVSTKPVSDVFGVAFAGVVRIGTLEAMGVDALAQATIIALLASTVSRYSRNFGLMR